MLIECGDFNAHIEKEDGKSTYHDKTNNNGKLMLEQTDECNLCITNTCFKKRECGDFNAHIEKEDGKSTYHDKTNNNGKLTVGTH